MLVDTKNLVIVSCRQSSASLRCFGDKGSDGHHGEFVCHFLKSMGWSAVNVEVLNWDVYLGKYE